MKKLKWILVALLLALVFCLPCLAEGTEAPLAVDTAALKERGECFTGLLPGATYEEALAAGLRLPEEPYINEKVDGIESKTYMLDREQQVVFGELAVKSAWFQFMNGRLVDVSLILEEEIPQEEIVALMTELFGEPTAESAINEQTGLGGVRWTLETAGELTTVHAVLARRESGVLCHGIGVTYWELVHAARGK